ncbi:NCAIR mutase (PurE)-related protein [Methanomicrobium sp. W14]|jgi:NCAIR mutase (PurE)-related protein|uniref:nickel pincer cofactor biosynthesis protein LarB n=1 Tax=Methanomicrobium sp. W14 TaxID=2817839 RepID=UPI001AE9AD99|nr:nickel pincer cofactor biosynthesis protein LarB [Methanomicrobium sp. W14]MBP2134581.1 NCAIR mutase (PurE)-related protein [Methanomicrobium sp. W14]
MSKNKTLKSVLESFKNGEISVEEAEVKIGGIRLDMIGECAKIDTGRNIRCGIPEVVLAENKDLDHLLAIVGKITEASGRCIASRVLPEQAESLEKFCNENSYSYEYNRKGRMFVVSRVPPPEKTGGIVGIITAGTSDIAVAEEAKVIAEEMGCVVKTAYDAGAAGIHRLFPAVKDLLDAHSFVVCAGREGTLPTIIAGLVDRPVIGVPVSIGYGYMGRGEAALASMLQSCAVLTVVNIDAGFTAGAYAALIANMAGGQ